MVKNKKISVAAQKAVVRMCKALAKDGVGFSIGTAEKTFVNLSSDDVARIAKTKIKDIKDA